MREIEEMDATCALSSSSSSSSSSFFRSNPSICYLLDPPPIFFSQADEKARRDNEERQRAEAERAALAAATLEATQKAQALADQRAAAAAQEHEVPLPIMMKLLWHLCLERCIILGYEYKEGMKCMFHLKIAVISSSDCSITHDSNLHACDFFIVRSPSLSLYPSGQVESA